MDGSNEERVVLKGNKYVFLLICFYEAIKSLALSSFYFFYIAYCDFMTNLFLFLLFFSGLMSMTIIILVVLIHWQKAKLQGHLELVI